MQLYPFGLDEKKSKLAFFFSNLRSETHLIAFESNYTLKDYKSCRYAVNSLSFSLISARISSPFYLRVYVLLEDKILNYEIFKKINELWPSLGNSQLAGNSSLLSPNLPMQSSFLKENPWSLFAKLLQTAPAAVILQTKKEVTLYLYPSI